MRIGSWMKVVSLQRMGEVDYVIWQGEPNNWCHKPFPAMDVIQAHFNEWLHEMHYSLKKNTTSEQAVATLKWEGVFR